MLLFGASGHAKVIISCLRANQISVLGIFDDDLSKKELWDIPVVGHYDPDFEAGRALIIAIGNNQIRRKIAPSIQHRFGKVVHPFAIIDETAQIEEGTVVFQSAVIQADARIGKHVIINTSSSVDHECILHDYVHIAPNATLCGNVQVGEGTLIGAGSIVAPNLTIGKGCMIAAGSVVTKHIPDFAIVRGNPARIIKITYA
ncbi:acetyltransferase [Runella sp.]|uniref:acetyltransferase n=1 Tax=Runella sp. TaxID=1960881 RepID=UPI003D0B4918